MSAEEQATTAAPAAAETKKEESFADSILTKYKTAGELANKAIQKVIALSVEGATILSLCKAGDEAVQEATNTVYKSDKKMSKGSAFPTSISVNHIICNFSPLPSEASASQQLKKGDVVKIQLGAQIDGYAAIVAETLVVGATKESPVEGKTADLLKAVQVASDVAIRVMKPGVTNVEVSRKIEDAIKEFGCRAVGGMQSNQMAKDVIDGKKKIVLAADPSSKPDTCKLEEDEVYGVDLSITTSREGNPKTDDQRTTIFKKTDGTFSLRTQTARRTFSEIQKKAGPFPFNLRFMEDETRARLGIKQCCDHALVTPFDVLYDAEKEAQTAQIFFTVAINSKGAIRLTPQPNWYSAEKVKTDKEVKSEELKTLLAAPVRQTKKKNKKTANNGESAPAATA